MAKGHILIVDDEASILHALKGILADEGFDVVQAQDGEVALRLIQEQPVDLVLLDIWMPGMDGIQTLQRIKALQTSICVIVMSGHGNIETAVKATRLGAFDYLEKPLSLDNVLSAVNTAFDHLWKTRDHQWVEVVQAAVEPLIGVSRPLQELRVQLEAAAQHEAPLLILGEPGSGKEFVARLIHQRQHHRRPFVRLYGDALSDDALERVFDGEDSLSALLGAMDDLELGDDIEGGTLYLDGLERLSPPALHTFTRLIGSARPQHGRGWAPLRMRVVAASLPGTGQDTGIGALPEELQRVFAATSLITIPLRHRIEDMPLLAEYFLRRAARTYGSSPKELHPEARQVLMAYDWPGNVKELKATLERVVLTTPRQIIGVENLPHHLVNPAGSSIDVAACGGYASLKEARRAWERQYLAEQLRKHRWNTARTAQALQLNERSLQRRLQVLGIRGRVAPGRVAVPQRTLQRSVVIHGQGLQSGVKTGMILAPLPPNSGILFGDIATGETVPAQAAYVESTGYATTLRRGLVTARTVEHIMAALHMYRITNVLVKIGGEVPFMDGSARDFCQLIEEAGVAEQAADAPLLKIRERHVWGLEDPDEKHFIVEPASQLTITYHLRYAPPIGRQQYTFVADSAAHFKAAIAPARTFGFVKEIEQLHALGMANGGRLTNVILVDESHIINTELRFPDEFVRHKVLDLLGDLYLTGKFVHGKITAYLTGHTENLALVKFLQSLSPEA
ncbi:MAG TPA: UDP-3-O-acyl-N-acetylglucosamine deacetylase [Candidatus Tectomicrobia bacterium]|nr:UDP-3-O-acyl-N-acetylglucosamine deacetylase [Candidatus Tectomicrobia bacterium]